MLINCLWRENRKPGVRQRPTDVSHETLLEVRRIQMSIRNSYPRKRKADQCAYIKGTAYRLSSEIKIAASVSHDQGTGCDQFIFSIFEKLTDPSRTNVRQMGNKNYF